ncbi:hypothetical protein TCAL_02349 [Tigriopus californicus]|uniref:BTB domain-containing protein n=1 Tax=Tigriopus californicus TaxID=6832 RepID=A0A553NYM9_TIGCA|nr:hypothetical protein TCAL_02349 [Tigriopus californicus]
MWQAFENGTGANLTLVCLNEEEELEHIDVQRGILEAASPVFQAMFKHEGFLEKQSGSVKIREIHPEVLKSVLRYLYTGILSNDTNVPIQEVLIAADRFQVEHLKILCEEKLCRNLDHEKVLDLAFLAQDYHAKYALDYAIQGIIHNFPHVAMGTHLIAEKWKHFRFDSKKLINLARGLEPCYFRLGGTAADLAIFQENPLPYVRPSFSGVEKCFSISAWGQGACEDLSQLYQTGNFTFGKSDWIQLNDFIKTVGWKFLFDVNVLLRNGDHWSAANARSLLDFNHQQGFHGTSWELGNEPNAYFHKFKIRLSGEQLGQDFRALRHLLDEYPGYENSSIVGPDINGVRKCANLKKDKCKAVLFLQSVLKHSGRAIDKITWHHYYLDGHKATLKDFLSAEVLNSLQPQMDLIKRGLEASNHSHIPIWLGETSSAYGGGVQGLSDRYVAGFLWLDKLGVAALNKYSVILRQTFYHGSYALVNEQLNPNPDYWLSLIFKRLVGIRVLELKQGLNNGTLRCYAHCHRDISGGVTVFALNIGHRSEVIKLGNQLGNSTVLHYILSPPKNSLKSREILLNGQTLKLNEFKDIPPLNPIRTSKTTHLFIKAYEMAFWVFPELSLKICS